MGPVILQYNSDMMMMMTIFHVDGVNYVSDLPPPAGLLLVPQVIHEYGEPWWSYVNRGKLLSRAPELSGGIW
jgi:hypothetical protein